MQIIVTRKEQLQTNAWSGGTTTQLAIYPETALYKNLDFIYRISTATIDVEQSVFTVLPNVAREIMVLDGELLIQHTGRRNKQLKKFDSDSFSGDWETTGMGKATDFNVMTMGNTKASVKGFSLPETQEKEIFLDCDVLGVYIYKGKITIEYSPSKLTLQQGDVALIYKEKENEAIKLQSIGAADIALACIHK